MLVLCINDEWVYPEDKATPKQHHVYEVLETRKGVSGRHYYILKSFGSNEGWATEAFTPVHIHTPDERTTKDKEAPKASAGPVREEAPVNC